MAHEPKTRPTDLDPRRVLAAVEPERRRQDALRLLEIMREETGAEAEMWGESIVGFGRFTLTYSSGRTAEWLRVGFAARARGISIYLLDECLAADPEPGIADLLGRLGKYKRGAACLSVTRLDAVDEAILRELIARTYRTFDDKTAI